MTFLGCAIAYYTGNVIGINGNSSSNCWCRSKCSRRFIVRKLTGIVFNISSVVSDSRSLYFNVVKKRGFIFTCEAGYRNFVSRVVRFFSCNILCNLKAGEVRCSCPNVYCFFFLSLHILRKQGIFPFHAHEMLPKYNLRYLWYCRKTLFGRWTTRRKLSSLQIYFHSLLRCLRF